MWNYKTADGRAVGLVRWIVVGTYNGVYEGSREMASGYILKELSQRAERLLSPCRPLKIIYPKQMELPPWLCVAQFEAPSGVRGDDGDDTFSRLYVCWFVEDTVKPLDEILQSILLQVDWDELAENYDIMGI